MNCEKCAAPMTLNPDRDFFQCEFCGAFALPEGTEHDSDIVILVESTGDLACSLCDQPLALASIDENRFLYCQSCRGSLIPRQLFPKLVNTQAAKMRSADYEPQPIDQDELKRKFDCPHCTEPMETHPYYGPGHVVIDSCHRCKMIWLDKGELDIVSRAKASKR